MPSEIVPLKTILPKTQADWVPTGETKYFDTGNRFNLIKFGNEMDCNHVFFINQGLSESNL